MSISLKEFFTDIELSGFFNNVPYLGAMNILSNKDISIYKLNPIDGEVFIYIMNTRNYGDLVLGDKFNVVFSMDNPREYIKTNAEVDYLTLKKGDNIGIMPNGRGGIVRLKFNGKIPEIIKFLKQDSNEEFNKEKHKFIYFTTQEVMDRILEELDKLENPTI